MILPRKNGFQNIKIKLNSRTWMTLESSVVIFQALKSLWPQWPQQPQWPQWPQWPRWPHFSKKTEFYVSIHSGTKMTYVEWIIKSFGTFFLGGCGGHPMIPKLNLKCKSQISKPNEYTDNIKSNSTYTFLSVRTKLKKKTLPSDTVYIA